MHLPHVNGSDRTRVHQNGVRQNESMPIAIAGMSFQFPDGATSDESFWSMIMEGRCVPRDFPPDRLDADSLYHPDPIRGDSVSLLRLRGTFMFLSNQLAHEQRCHCVEDTLSTRIWVLLMHLSFLCRRLKQQLWIRSRERF